MTTLADVPRFLSVKQVAEYLNVHEKKVYALVSEGKIPGTKVTGKWLFPRELVDQWMLESSHGGLLSDRLVLAGSDDALLHRVIPRVADRMRSRALVSFTPIVTRLGLELLHGNRVDACCVHWGPAEESQMRHPALIRSFPQHRHWVIIRAFQREQGFILNRSVAEYFSSPDELPGADLRWIQRQQGSGTQRFLRETLGLRARDPSSLKTVCVAHSERESAALIAMDEADVAPGTRSAAREFGLAFLPAGWEAFDFVLNRSIYFRTLFRELLAQIQSGESRREADRLQGYDLSSCGRMIWSEG
ncbi:helix-turn-helix transcriptional regulator [Thioalkalivibrio paradoxus]|uniref:DNA-binding protein n=1 Tax=Thioalkalivibrio paradoxus ARh 1 TaxID=713585 RepID=W0DK57_9GAMM|nr:helix-turn-helix transcriptional regulator [Thioalkalivibrio paradoxus]AHE97265.1 DNA-binding protein [Thioalkalivibrio paradoxus ARh 1]